MLNYSWAGWSWQPSPLDWSHNNLCTPPIHSHECDMHSIDTRCSFARTTWSKVYCRAILLIFLFLSWRLVLLCWVFRWSDTLNDVMGYSFRSKNWSFCRYSFGIPAREETQLDACFEISRLLQFLSFSILMFALLLTSFFR